MTAGPWGARPVCADHEADPASDTTLEHYLHDVCDRREAGVVFAIWIQGLATLGVAIETTVEASRCHALSRPASSRRRAALGDRAEPV